jgi:hypothetical protein
MKQILQTGTDLAVCRKVFNIGLLKTRIERNYSVSMSNEKVNL